MKTPERRAELFTRTGNPRHNTVEVWAGPSRIEGSPLVVLVTGLKESKNTKTGDMVQSYIIRSDMDPLQALRTGADAAMCGACGHKAKAYDGATWSGRSCYVRVDTAPLGIYRAWDRGNVPKVTPSELSGLTQGRMVRLGTYGDPASVPLAIWDAYTAHATGWTGYTHQASNRRLRDVLKYCQISADSEGDTLAARGAGIGSFRVLAQGESALPFEMVCPASEEAGKVATCATCKACSGLDGANVVINSHGIGKGHHSPSKRRALTLPVLNPARVHHHQQLGR
jgi:hypothetical protein